MVICTVMLVRRALVKVCTVSVLLVLTCCIICNLYFMYCTKIKEVITVVFFVEYVT